MLSGRVARFSHYELALSCSASTGSGGTHAGASHTWLGVLETRFSPDTLVLDPGIRLEVSGSTPGSASARIRVPLLGIDFTGGGVNSCGIVFDDLRLRVRQASYLWRLSWASVRVFAGGALVHTGGAGTLDGSGLGPSWVPLLGIPPMLTGSCFAGLNPPSPTPTSYSAWAETSATVAGGWRFAYSGENWQMPPLVLQSYVDPGGAGPFGLTPEGIATAQSTWNGAIAAYSRYDLDLVPNRQPFVHRGDRRTRHGSVLLAPCMDRSAVRGCGADTAALVVRGGFPRTLARGERSWVDIRIPDMGANSNDPEVHPRLTEMLGTLTQDANPGLEGPLGTITAPWWGVNTRHQAEVAAT